MSTISGRDGLGAGYSSDQVAFAKALQNSMTSAGSKARPGRGRSSAPSPATSAGRGRGGHAMASTRPVASAVPPPNPYHSFTSTAACRNTHAPGATKSGAINPHFAQYSVGASTAAPTFKSPPRQRTVSPVRAFGGPAAVLAPKPKSPTKLRSSILVADTAQRVDSSPGNTMNGDPQGQVVPQSGWFNASEKVSANVNPTPNIGGWVPSQVSHDVDPRFMAVKSSHSMAQQPGGNFFDDHGQTMTVQGQSTIPTNACFNGMQGHGQNTAVQEFNTMPSNDPFNGNQGQGSIPHAGQQANQAVPDTGRVRITTNWTDEDSTKPIIPGHLRQPDGGKVIVEIAGNVGLPTSNCHGVMTVGISSSIHAPGNARSNNWNSAGRANPNSHQGDVNDTEWMTAATNRNHSNRIPSGDGDVEMSDIQANNRSSAPQGPVEWSKLPTLAASRYATPSTFASNPPKAPQPPATSNVGNENIKPTNHVLAEGLGGFGDINKNIAADLAKNFGFNGAPGQGISNPFIANGGQAVQTPTHASGFSAAAIHSAGINPFLANAAGPPSAQSLAHVTNASNGFGAPSAPPANETVDNSSPTGGNGFGASYSDNNSTGQLMNASIPHQNGFGAPSAPSPVVSANQFASNGPNGFPSGSFGASLQPGSQSLTIQTNTNCFGAQATGGAGPAAQFASNGQPGVSSSGFGFSQTAPADQFVVNGPSGASGNGQAFHGFPDPQSTGMAQAKVNPLLSNGSGAASQSSSTSQGARINPFMSNGSPSSQPARVSGYGGSDAAKLAASIDNDIRRMYGTKPAAPTYEASPFGPQDVRSAVAPSASDNRLPGLTPPVYQVVPEIKKATGLSASRWA
ncbi:hypothetical protein ONS95_007578 [Cadophora gregata]|uniref:uncharacterized protein n=1 Tax=Cadophora gregata TaxID=51156 RepID=UPI0026DC4A64|nr:uncharacterized protein ONS95_007578 [Cadophora gregata]KAK0125956.1 hypothetical protein ONS95_007578 [Cadophora gregata]